MSENTFLDRLRKLVRREDRGALAALRRGLGRPPGSAAEMHPFVAPFLPDEAWTWHNQCLYIVGALFALHPELGGSGSLGNTFRRMQAGSDSDSTERRFVALLKCHRYDLFEHLRHAVSLARAAKVKGKDTSIDWEQLLKDIRNWDSDDAWVQRKWSQAFWGAGRESANDSEEATQPSDKETRA